MPPRTYTSLHNEAQSKVTMIKSGEEFNKKKKCSGQISWESLNIHTAGIKEIERCRAQ